MSLLNESKHLQGLLAGLSVCACRRCIEHYTEEVARVCANLPLDSPAEHQSENGTAAHLRTQIRIAANIPLHDPL